MSDFVLEEFLQEILSLPEYIGFPSIDIHTRGNWNSTPLHIAATRGNIAAIAALLDAGSEINSRGEHGYSPLHEAAAQGNVEAAQLLLLRGASVTAKNDDNQTPLQCCNEKKIAEILRIYAT